MPSQPDAGTLVGLLADPVRLKVVAAIALGAANEEKIAEVTGLEERAVRAAVQRMAVAGLVGPGEEGGLSIRVELLARAARTASQKRRAAESTPQDFGATPEQAKVLRNFMSDGRITALPTNRSKRLVMLDFLANRFDPGQVYPEKEVNFRLMSFHPDAAALRRYLVDEGFMERRDGFYWRTGGTYEVE
jgi:hypothetical protein